MIGTFTIQTNTDTRGEETNLLLIFSYFWNSLLRNFKNCICPMQISQLANKRFQSRKLAAKEMKIAG